MQKLKKIFLISLVLIVTATSFSVPENVEAANIFGVTEAQGCETSDPFFPVLLICGRSKSTGACEAYTKQCSVGDAVATAGRLIIWLISAAFLLVPLLIIYYGAMVIINKEYDGGISMIKTAKDRLKWLLIYVILMLGAWLIIRTVVDVFQVDTRINTFLIDENGQKVESRNFQN